MCSTLFCFLLICIFHDINKTKKSFLKICLSSSHLSFQKLAKALGEQGLQDTRVPAGE
jgi:hypothetical protein